MFFSKVHRLSCSILERNQTEDLEITQEMSELIDNEVENASHDFDKIKQDGCEHDREKVLNIDVDKILGLVPDFEINQNTVDEIKDEIESVEEFEVQDLFKE